VLFLAGCLLQSSVFGESRSFTRPLFCVFVKNLDRLAGQPIYIFHPVQIWIQIWTSTMDSKSQARGGRGGRSGGVPNYKNDVLINIVEMHLPHGLEAWREVAEVYQRESCEVTLR
jgi:hypothetical protein